MCQKILCLGDSNTYGYDPRNRLGGRYPEAVRWTGRLEKAGWKVANDGENGRAIPRLECEIEAAIQAVLREKPDVLAIMLGSNDLLQRPGLAAEACGERMERFLAGLAEKTPEGPRVLLVAPPPMEPGAWVPDPALAVQSRRLAGCYKALAERLNIGFADAGKWGVELAFDGVHFSEAGHEAFARGMLEALGPGNPASAMEKQGPPGLHFGDGSAIIPVKKACGVCGTRVLETISLCGPDSESAGRGEEFRS